MSNTLIYACAHGILMPADMYSSAPALWQMALACRQLKQESPDLEDDKSCYQA